MKELTFSFVVATIFLPRSTYQLQCKTCAIESSPVEKNVLDILRNLPSSQICVWSPNLNEETELHLLKILSGHKALVIFKAGTVSKLPDTCLDNIFVHNFTDQETCTVYFSSLRLTVYHTLVLLVVSDSRFCADTWSQCSGKFGSGRVLLVSLGGSCVFSLSSPLFPPRMFVPADLSAALTPMDITPLALTGREVTVATFNCSPFVVFKENKDLDRLHGIEGGVLRELKNKLNFSMRIAPLAGDGRWGAVVNNTWNGGIGRAVADGTAELGVCNIWNVLQYYYIADFGPPTNVVTFTFIVPRPRLIQHRWQGLVTALSGEAWICTVAACLATALCYSLHSYCHSPSTSITDHLLEGILVVWGKLTLSSWWARTASQLISWWCAFVLLLSAVYSSSIVAQLTTPRYEPRLDTVRQLVEGGYHWIDGSNSPHWKAIYFDLNNKWQARWERRYKFVKPEGLVDAVRSRRAALPIQRWGRDLVFFTLLGLDYERDLDDMRVLRETTSETRVGFIIAKGCPLQAVFQLTLLRFSEIGLFNYWASHTVLSHGEKYSKLLLQERDDHVETSAKQLRMNNLSPAFVILACGLIASLLVFMAEVLWHWHTNKRPFPFILCLL